MHRRVRKRESKGGNRCAEKNKQTCGQSSNVSVFVRGRPKWWFSFTRPHTQAPSTKGRTKCNLKVGFQFPAPYDGFFSHAPPALSIQQADGLFLVVCEAPRALRLLSVNSRLAFPRIVVATSQFVQSSKRMAKGRPWSLDPGALYPLKVRDLQQDDARSGH